MRTIVGYLRDYWLSLNKKVFGSSACLIAFLIFLNYQFSISPNLSKQPFYYCYLGWYFIFLLALSFPYFIQYSIEKKSTFIERKFIVLLLIAPGLFAWKMASNLNFSISTVKNDNAYWNHVLYWPIKLVVLSGCLWIVWKLFNKEQPFYGTSTYGFKAKPYLLMLIIMLPLIAAASTQPDFLSMYPKLTNISNLIQPNEGWKKLLYELSYGSDFVGIELFFRGFLILAFAKWVGKDAILPMALFYCTIHFGKPLGECISSFFGGLILGVVTYHTRTIWGGLMVHLGIAWMMELGGYIGNLYF
ncbi:MAG TPA: CPBP family intramembrane glutamic endopeptidase [Flavisolibacter sp.]|nr:CPBP family intramembrane glutamic endopeptidase [Flavisolibacter sp.]